MISGANRGVGLALAGRLHEAGYQISAGARDVEALRTALAARLGGAGDDRLLCHGYDATESGSDAAWLDATLERFGGLDVVVNNAGVLDTARLEDLTMDSLDHLLD